VSYTPLYGTKVQEISRRVALGLPNGCHSWVGVSSVHFGIRLAVGTEGTDAYQDIALAAIQAVIDRNVGRCCNVGWAGKERVYDQGQLHCGTGIPFTLLPITLSFLRHAKRGRTSTGMH